MLRRYRIRNRWVKLLLPALLAGLLASCGGGGDRVKSYGNDGYMGIQNSDPSLPITGSSWSYNEDAGFAAQLLSRVPGIRDTSIVFDGSVMRVKLFLNRTLSREDAARVTAKAERMLSGNFPRYRVEVAAEQ